MGRGPARAGGVAELKRDVLTRKPGSGLCIEVCRVEHRLDVDDRRAVHGFDGADAKPVPDDPPHGDSMKAQRIRPIWRARREDTRQRAAPIRARINLQHVPPRPVEPGHNDDVGAGDESVESVCGEPAHVKPRVRRTLRALLRRPAARLDDGADHADRPNLSASSTVHWHLLLISPDS